MGEALVILEYLKYGMILLGVLAGFPLIWRRREKLGLKGPGLVLLVCLGFSAGSVLAALLFATLEGLISGNGFHFGAISTYGVYLFCPMAVILAAKAAERDAGRWVDVFALYALPSLFLMRCNCLMNGCCGGRPIGDTELSWPTRQAEMIFYAVMLVVLLRREKAGAPKGAAFPLLTAAYGAFRFVEEWFRSSSGTSLLHLAHLWSVLAFISGLGFYYELNSGRARANGLQKERRISKC